MAQEADTFSVQLLDEAKRFLEKAGQSDEQDAFLHASLVLAFSALESHVNGVAEELTLRQGTTLLDEAVLSEHGLKLKGGEWQLTPDVRFYRLEERVAFLFIRFGQKNVVDYSWWSVLKEAVDARNALVHPRNAVTLTLVDMRRFLSSILDALNDLYLAVFGRGHPSYGRGLQSTLTF